MRHKNEKITILGAGLAGSLLSSMLAQQGFNVSVIEKRPDPRNARLVEGRSINLALSHRGIHALRYANAFEGLANELIPMKGRMMHDSSNHLTFQPYGKEGQHINSVSRNGLNCKLIDKAERENVTFYFEAKCVDLDLDNGKILIEKPKGGHESMESEVIIGADGAFSAMRRKMQFFDRFNFQQQYIEHGYKELSMPSSSTGDFQMEPNYLHIWPRGNFMLIALPNPDKSFTCTLFFPYEGDKSFESLNTEASIHDFFRDNFPDIPEKIKDYETQYRQNPTSSLVTMRCFPWNYKRCLLLGDAAHAIVPFYGQGMNAAFEDCRLLVELGEKNGFHWERLFSEFSQKRKPDADAIADLALKNFIEMRDEVADNKFLARKKADAQMHEEFGDRWIPLYTQVSFTDIPYAEALKHGKMQEKALVEAQKENKLEDHQSVYEILNKLLRNQI